MRSPKLFRHHPGRSIESGRDATNTIAIATATLSYQEIYHRLLPIHQPERYLCAWGKAVTGVTGMIGNSNASLFVLRAITRTLATVLRSSVTT